MEPMFLFFSVGTVGTKGIMFLNEVALGNEYNVAVNHSHLKDAPAGHDCVIAQGNTEPGKSVKSPNIIIFMILLPNLC